MNIKIKNKEDEKEMLFNDSDPTGLLAIISHKTS